MTTVTNPVLPIPEDTIQGTGSYTVPANKYAKFDGNCNSTAYAYCRNNDQSSENQSTNSDGNSSAVSLILKEGNSITTSTSDFNQTAGNTNFVQLTSFAYARISLGGSVVCESQASAATGWLSGNNTTYLCQIESRSTAVWNASIYPIPKNNLPLNLIEGN